MSVNLSVLARLEDWLWLVSRTVRIVVDIVRQTRIYPDCEWAKLSYFYIVSIESELGLVETCGVLEIFVNFATHTNHFLICLYIYAVHLICCPKLGTHLSLYSSRLLVKQIESTGNRSKVDSHGMTLIWKFVIFPECIDIAWFHITFHCLFMKLSNCIETRLITSLISKWFSICFKLWKIWLHDDA